ncbi:MAG: type II secretion system F family protein [Acidobacteria bacterium]|nr:type II secretion system F family protein [Acidobacteriota bacterium]
MALVVAAVVFLLVTGVVLGGAGLMSKLPAWLMRRKLHARLREGARLDVPEAETSVLRQQHAGPLPGFNQLVGRSRYGSSLTRLADQAGVKVGPGVIVLASCGCGVVAFLATAMWLPAVAILAAGLALPLPVLYLRFKRARRRRQFEERFPEALDLLSRAIRAGHGFTTAMTMVAEDLEEPIGPEFRKTIDEHNFGLPLKDALNGLSERIPLLDVRFFATAVLTQRETGGNLSEILENLARVVRERFKILRQVRVYTAHGRFTGYVLLALPAGLLCVLYFINPDHVQTLFSESIGRALLVGAVVMQAIGYVWIRQIVRIEV